MDNQEIRTKLKAYFKSGNIPKEVEFSELIDEALNPDAARLSTGKLENDRLPNEINLTGTEQEPATISADKFIGNGAQLTSLNASEIITGTLANDRLPNAIDLTGTEQDPSIISADKIIGNGTQLTNLNASEIITGTLANDRLPNAINLTGSEQDPSKISADQIIGNGAGLTNLNASEMNTGTLASDRLPKVISLTGTEQDPSKISADQFIGSGAGLSQLSPAALSGALPFDKLPMASESDWQDNADSLDSQLMSARDGKNLNKKIETLTYPQAATDVQYVETEINHDIESPRTVDGAALAQEDLVLLTAQTDASQNRVWQWNNGKLVIPEAYEDKSLAHGLLIKIEKGESHNSKLFVLKTSYVQEGVLSQIQWQQVHDRFYPGTGLMPQQNRLDVDFASGEDVSNQVANKSVDAALLAAQLSNIQTSLQTLQAGAGLEIADNLISVNTENLTVLASNIDGLLSLNSLPQASQEQAGVCQFATDVQVQAGTESNLAISPVQLAQLLAELPVPQVNKVVEILGSKIIFANSFDNEYSISVDNAVKYEWLADGVSIIKGAATNQVTVKADSDSGSLFVKVTNADGSIIEKSVDIKVKAVSGNQVFEYSGSIETWQVPEGVTSIKIEAWGAQGGECTYKGTFKGGKGAYAEGVFVVPKSSLINIVVGQQGGVAASYQCGGGGGSFIYFENAETPLVISGGGGGGGSDNSQYCHGTSAINGNSGFGNYATFKFGEGGVNGNGGKQGTGGSSLGSTSGGGGWITEGEGKNLGKSKYNFSGGAGTAKGGFGGGGGSSHGSAGGGGYSGGGGGGWNTSPYSYSCGTGGGGGSYVASNATTPKTLSGARQGNGQIIITW